MTTYYIEKDGKIKRSGKDKNKFENTIKMMPDFKDLEIQETERPLVLSEDGTYYVFADTDEYLQEQAEKEKARIQELYMTRSDFFDATIKAFGADEDDLLTAIASVLTPMGIDNTSAKIALNNYKNALNFYRKHPLFTMLSNVPIPISEQLVINISSEQWDKFFDETNKKNPLAYKELLPKFTLTITVTPEDSLVVINGQEIKNITVPYGTQVEYTVSKDGYTTQTEQIAITENIIKNIILEEIAEDNLNEDK